MIPAFVRTGFAFFSLQTLLGPALLQQGGDPDTDTFTLKDTYVGEDFLHHWVWEAVDDPTHGRVDYVDQQKALGLNLTYASNSKFVMRADFEHTVEDRARGRKSVRIFSIEKYAESLAILDLQHMPEGCATWPSFWARSADGPWPQGGEVDIIQGVNLDRKNLVTLHTTSDCKMSDNKNRRESMNGEIKGLDCDAAANYGEGCGVSMRKPASFGHAFNAAGGGYFAAVRTDAGGDAPKINVWFWTRADPAVPDEIRDPAGHDKIAPTEQWGRPEAHFYLGENCAYGDHFDKHQFAFGLNLCGDWAGNVYPSACPGSCVDHVNNHPEAFKDAYWEINSLHVYTHQ